MEHKALLHILFKGEDAGRFRVVDEITRIGRSRECQLVIDNLSTSSVHCELVKRGPSYWVRDVGSANGTYVNGRRIDKHYLRDQDEIGIGKYSLIYHNEDAASIREIPPLEEVEEPKAVPSGTYAIGADQLEKYLIDQRERKTEGSRFGTFRVAGMPPTRRSRFSAALFWVGIGVAAVAIGGGIVLLLTKL